MFCLLQPNEPRPDAVDGYVAPGAGDSFQIALQNGDGTYSANVSVFGASPARAWVATVYNSGVVMPSTFLSSPLYYGRLPAASGVMYLPNVNHEGIPDVVVLTNRGAQDGIWIILGK